MFEISGYAEEGAPLLAGSDFSRLVAPFIGKRKTTDDIDKARSAVQQAYFDLGYCSVVVGSGQREPESGGVTFKITQSAMPLAGECLPMAQLNRPVASSAEVRSATPVAERMAVAASTNPAQTQTAIDVEV